MLFCICSALLIKKLYVVRMASVDSIISLLATDSLSYDKKLELKQTGRDQPMFLFAGKKQCRPLEQYSKLTLLIACPIRKSVLRKMRELDIICDALPEVTNALKASLTVALTSVTCERNFSVVGSSLSSL